MSPKRPVPGACSVRFFPIETAICFDIKNCGRHQKKAQCECTLGLIHTVRFFRIATVIPLIATNGLHRTQWKFSHYVTAIISPIPI